MSPLQNSAASRSLSSTPPTTPSKKQKVEEVKVAAFENLEINLSETRAFDIAERAFSQLMKEVDDYYQQGCDISAITILSNAILNSKDEIRFELFVKRAEIYFGMYEDLKEIELLSSAIFDLAEAQQLRLNDEEIKSRQIDFLSERVEYYLNTEVLCYDCLIRDLSELINLDPKNSYFLYTRGETFLKYSNGCRSTQEQEFAISCGLEDLILANKIEPQNKEILFQLGLGYFQKKLFKESVKVLTEILALNSNSPKAFLWIGMSFLEQREFDLALENFNCALMFDRTLIEVFRFRGNTHLLLGNYQKALNDLNEYLRIVKDDLYCLEKRAEVYHKMGELYLSAVDKLKVLEKESPDNVEEMARLRFLIQFSKVPSFQ